MRAIMSLSTKRWVGGAALALAVLILCGPRAIAEDEAGARSQCWSLPLRGLPGESRIKHGFAGAYVPLPNGQLASSPVPPAWRGVIRRVDLPPGVKKVALTFDLCEQPYEKAGYDSEIVDFLRESGTRATFFGGGKWIETHEQRARQIIADPLFEMGNHTWEHRNLRLLSGKSLVDEIAGAQLAYAKVYTALANNQCLPPDRENKVNALVSSPGQPLLFRFPFGACDPRSLRAVADAGLLAIQWDVSSGDPLRTLLPARMADWVLHGVRPGSIVLFHANGRGWHTAQALRRIVPELRARQYEFVTVSELLNANGARPVIAQTCYDSRPGDTDHYDSFARRLEAEYQKFKAEYGTKAPRVPAGTSSHLPAVPKPVPAVRARNPVKEEPKN